MEECANVSIEARVLSRSGGPGLSLAEHDQDHTTQRRPSSGGPSVAQVDRKLILQLFLRALSDLVERPALLDLAVLEDGDEHVIDYDSIVRRNEIL